MSPSTGSPSKVEGVAQVAQTTVDALKSTPILLAVLLFNLMFMVTLGYVTLHNSSRWDNDVQRWAEIAKACIKSP